MIKCKFCNFPLLYIENINSSAESLLCVKCPVPIYFNFASENYTIYCLHGEYWYEIIYLKLSKQYLIYQNIHSIYIDTDYGRELNKVERKLLTQLLSEPTITPQNVHEKLLTILTFG